jgi:dipeptidyl aminopeptidase/acylaminoacyl peptidase
MIKGILSFCILMPIALGCPWGECLAADTSSSLLDRGAFFTEPEITGARVSPDGKFLAFLRPLGAVQNIWVKRTNQPLAMAQPVAAVNDHSPDAFYWSRDNRYLLFTRDAGGQGKPDLFAVDVNSIGAPGGAPEARNLTNGQGTPAQILAVPQAAPNLAYVALTDGQRPEHDVYAIEIATGKRSLLRRNDIGAAGWLFDLAGKPRLATRTGKYGAFELVRLDAAGSALVYSCSWSDTCIPLQFDPDGWHVYLASNHGEKADLVRLISLDVRNGHEEVVASDPAQQVDLDETVFSPQTRRPAATVYKGDAGLRYAWSDRSMQVDFQRLQRRLPGMDLRLQAADDGQDWLVFASADREPGEAYLFDRRTGALSLQYRLLPSLPRGALARTTVIHYPSADGLEIHAYLTLPRGVKPKSLPLVVLPHEGPWNVRDEWGYSNLAQILANRGFAVLQPNFRGSIGFGKRFLAAGDRQWGGRMQDDINWGARRVVAAGIADPKRIAILGLSYGGFAALAGAAFTPDLYAAAIDMSGPSDLALLMKSVTAYMPGARILFVQSVGDASTSEGMAQLERQSPVNAADKIKAPLLIIQGALDPLSPQAQSDEIVAVLRARHAPVTYLLAGDEAHVLGPGKIWAHPVNNLAVLAEIESFLGETMGTRWQRDMTPEVAQRIKELTVPADSGTSDPRR